MVCKYTLASLPFSENLKRLSLPYWVYIAIATIVYGSIWSYIGVTKILALNAYVFDLGINSERGWLILHTNLGLHGYLTTLINSGIVYPLSPLTGFGNFFAMIIFQAFSIAIVGPALYLIAKEKGLKARESMLLSLAFFLYFPVYGIMWFDFHYQVFFMPLFIFAYLLYVRKNYAASVLLFFLSGIVRYPYSIFPLAFAFIELFLLLRQGHTETDIRRIHSMLCLLILMVIWTLLGFLMFGLASTIPHSSISHYTVSVVSPWSRTVVILIFLAPLLFIPVLRVRWFILVVPAFYLFMFSSYAWYAYPQVFQGQYVAGVVPFLFLGLIDYLTLPNKRGNGIKKTITFKVKLFKRHSTSRPIIAVLAIILFLNIFFAPFSPLNNQYGDQFNFQQNVSYNPLQYSELGSMIKMIPSNDPYVSYQNNIPEIFPRATPPGGALLMGGYLGSFSNVSINEAINNSWQVNAGGSEVSLPVDFALADASNPNFYLAGNSPYSIVHDMYESGRYGIVSEGYGLILLQRDYNGTVKNYVPENFTIMGGSFANSSDASNLAIGSNIGNTTVTVGKYSGIPFYLFPGRFIVSLYLNSQSQINATNMSSINLGVYSGSHSLMTLVGNNSHLNTNFNNYRITFSFALNGIAGNVWFAIYGLEKSSRMSVSKIVVSETSAFQHC